MDETKTHPSDSKKKRVMTPAIIDMTVKEERACLSEIRKLGPDVNHEYVLSNGWTTGRFALMYVTGQHIKRKAKSNKSLEELNHLDNNT